MSAMFEFFTSVTSKLAATLSAAIIAVMGLVVPAREVTTVPSTGDAGVAVVVVASNSNSDQVGSSAADKGEPDDFMAELEALRKEMAELKNGSKVVSRPIVVEAPPVVKQSTHLSVDVDFIDPAIVINSDSRIVKIHGSGFKNGLTVSTGDNYLELATNFDPNPQPLAIFVRVPAGMNPGTYSIKVKNPDGGIAILDQALTIKAGLATQDDSLSTTDIVNKLRQAVVLIRTDTGCGSGIVIDRGEILTNNHVVDDTNSARILLNGGQILSAAVVARNQQQDLALLKPVGDYKLSFTMFSASDEQSLPAGSEVVALGYPLTCNEDFTLITEEGSITGRRVGLLQTSARIHSGNSGGPLVSKKTGQVIGINRLIIGEDGYNTTGIAFSIQADDAWDWLVDVRSR